MIRDSFKYAHLQSCRKQCQKRPKPAIEVPYSDRKRRWLRKSCTQEKEADAQLLQTAQKITESVLNSPLNGVKANKYKALTSRAERANTIK